jgi:hypothetical protein
MRNTKMVLLAAMFCNRHKPVEVVATDPIMVKLEGVGVS